ncbi:MAG: ATP-binding cassette domain-containing protein [Chitinophagales bacterium]|nr:ATP-binding cassette domain-containing protein [Chitinophagales bacterium]
MIQAQNIHKSFGAQHVLKGITADFHSGQCNMVIGKSGSGKTVFMNCIVGLVVPEVGSMLLDNRNIVPMGLKEKSSIRKEMGMLFQKNALFDSMTVEENVRFPLDMFTEMSTAEKRDRVNFCLQRVSLINSNHKFPSELSGGMMKRVALARAMVLNPKYLFCDEPNSGLDPQTALVIDELIQEITREYNITTVINTHDMNSVIGIGDKILFLYDGEKNWEGSNKEILHTDNEKLNDFIFASEFLKEIRKLNYGAR